MEKKLTNKEQAAKIAKDLKVDTVWMNDKGEFFTREDHAKDSGGGKLEKFEFPNSADVKASEKEPKLYKLTKKDMGKYPELATNGWKEGEEVQELDWAMKNKKPAE